MVGVTSRSRWIVACLALLTFLVPLASCGRGVAPEVTSQSPTASSSIPTPEASSEPPSTPQTPSSVSTETPEPTNSGQSPTTKPTLGPEDAGRKLKVADVHSVEPSGTQIKDDIFKVGQTEEAGMGVTVEQCGDGEPVTLELRLGLSFSKLSFDFGQELNASEDSDQILVARVEGDDEDFLKSAKTPLKSKNHVDADVKGVAAAKIKLYLDKSKCDYESSVYAVLMNLTVE